MSMKNSNDAIGNRTRDLPACSAMPQTTAPPGAPEDVSQFITNFPSDCLGRDFSITVGVVITYCCNTNFSLIVLIT
jgi:hypothetical protein